MTVQGRVVLVMGLGLTLTAWPRFATAQACKDELSIWEESKKNLAELVTTVKQESLESFERSYHQKTAVSKLSFLGSTVEEVLTCLEKAQQDPAASKEVVAWCKSQQEIYAKLKDQVGHDIDALKALTASKDAKDYAGKLSEVS